MNFPMMQIRWLWSRMDKKLRPLHIIAMLISAGTSLMILINPTLTARLMDEVIIAQNPEPLMGILLTMLFVKIGRECMRYLMVVLTEITSQNVLSNLRTHLFERIQHQDAHYFDINRAGDLMTRLSADIDWCRHFLSFIDRVLMDCVVEFLAVSIYLFFVNWKLALALAAVTPLMALVSRVFSRKARPKFMDMRDRMSDMNAAAQENIAGNRVVKAFAREDYENKQFDAKSFAFLQANLDTNKLWLTFFPVIETLAQSMGLIALFLGGALIMIGELTPGELTIFTSLTWALTVPMRNLGNLLNDWQRFSTCASKVMEVDLSVTGVDEPKDAKPHDRVQGRIEFDHVSFDYGSGPVLKDVSFTAEPGSTIAVIGPTGSGKTTMIHLLSRVYDTVKGEVRIDGDDVRTWRFDDLRRGIAVATQDVFLFSDTVDGNIAFGTPDLSDAEMRAFAQNAQAADFIVDLADGYDTVVGERGVGLSGGQKQRIALARALAMKPGILVMDDTTSAVDMETERAIQQELKKLPYTCTKFIVAQRISSVKDADQILVLKDGRIAEQGTHAELLAKRGYYYETYCLQNGIEYEEVNG